MTPDISSAMRQYPNDISGRRWVPLGAAGGFSGALIWRGERVDGFEFSLKRWPVETTDRHLRRVHSWMEGAREAGVAVVPQVRATVTGDSVVQAAGHCWDVTDWMPGTPALCETATPQQWASAGATLAEMHRAWAARHTELAPPPAVTRRLRLLDEWERTITPRAFDRLPSTERDWLVRVRQEISGQIEWCRRKLQAWAARSVPLHPCLCDGRPEHFLFTEGAVSGVIDYGAMRVDTPAVDLARLMANGVDTPGSNLALGLTAYANARPPFDVPEPLVRSLVETGALCAAANWQLRLADRPPPANLRAVLDRVGRLVQTFRQ